MKFKIQIPACGGWCDLMASEDDGETYCAELYETRDDAEREGRSIRREIEDFEFRVVPENCPSCDDLYGD